MTKTTRAKTRRVDKQKDLSDDQVHQVVRLDELQNDLHVPVEVLFRLRRGLGDIHQLFSIPSEVPQGGRPSLGIMQ